MTSKSQLRLPTLTIQLFIHLITRHWDLAENKTENIGLLELPFLMGGGEGEGTDTKQVNKRGNDRFGGFCGEIKRE